MGLTGAKHNEHVPSSQFWYNISKCRLLTGLILEPIALVYIDHKHWYMFLKVQVSDHGHNQWSCLDNCNDLCGIFKKYCLSITTKCTEHFKSFVYLRFCILIHFSYNCDVNESMTVRNDHPTLGLRRL